MLAACSRHVVLHINDFLPWIGGFAFKQTCKAIFVTVQSRVSPKPWYQDDAQLVSRRIFTFFPECEKTFIDALNKYNHWLGGSFVLSCILNETWSANDVDVFTLATRPDTKYIRYQEDGRVKYVERRPSPGELLLHEYSGHTAFMHDAFQFKSPFYTEKQMDDMSGNRNSFGNKIRKKFQTMGLSSCKYEITALQALEFVYEESKAKLDYVFLNPDEFKSVKHFFNLCNDFDFCACLFDGQRFHIKNLESVCEKKCRTDLDQIVTFTKQHGDFAKWTAKTRLWKRVYKRREKYQNRGFTMHVQGSTDCFFHTIPIARRKSLSDVQAKMHSRNIDFSTRDIVVDAPRALVWHPPIFNPPIFRNCRDDYKKRSLGTSASCPSSPASSNWRRRLFDPTFPQEQIDEYTRCEDADRIYFMQDNL